MLVYGVGWLGLCCAVLCCTVLCCTVLYCTEPFVLSCGCAACLTSRSFDLLCHSLSIIGYTLGCGAAQAVEDVPGLRLWLLRLLHSRLFPLIAALFPVLGDGTTIAQTRTQTRTQTQTQTQTQTGTICVSALLCCVVDTG